MNIYSVWGALTVVVVISILMALGLELGHRLGRYAKRRHADPIQGTSVVEGAVLTLLGLMLTFTLAQSKDNYQMRKQLLIDTVNAVTTMHDRTEMLPEPHRAEVRRYVRRYVDALLAASRSGTSDHEERNDPHRESAMALQHEIWTHSVAGCAGDEGCQQVLLPAINRCAELAFAHLALTQSHKPWALLGFLALLAICGAVLAGYSLSVYKERQWVHGTLYVFAIAVSIYMIIEVEFPRWGFIRIASATAAVDEILVRLAQ